MKRKRESESAVDLTRQSEWRKRRSSLCSAPSSQADRADRLTDTYCVGRTDGRTDGIQSTFLIHICTQTLVIQYIFNVRLLCSFIRPTKKGILKELRVLSWF